MALDRKQAALDQMYEREWDIIHRAMAEMVERTSDKDRLAAIKPVFDLVHTIWRYDSGVKH